MAKQPATDGGVRAVSRAIRLLSAFERDALTRSVAELVAHTGLPRTTVLRLVETLQAEGMLENGPDGRVRVGARLVAWASLAGSAWQVPEATLERMRRVAADTGETVSIYVRAGVRRTVIAQAQGPHRLRHVVDIGDELPLWGGAAAMVLLSQEPDARRAELVAGAAAEPDAARSLDAIADAVEAAGREGWAISHGLREPGNTGLAVPVPGPDGGPLPLPAALALGGPTLRFDDAAIDRFRVLLTDAAADLWRTGLPPALR